MEYEDQDWMAAFNLNLSVASMYELLFNWFGDSDSSSVQGVVYSRASEGTSNGSDSFGVVSSVQDGYTPTGVTVDDRRELYFNSEGAGSCVDSGAG